MLEIKNKEVVMKKAFSLIEMMVVAVIVLFLAGFAMPQLLKTKITANDLLAKRTLNLLATAVEKYAIDHQSKFPTSIEELTTKQEPYLSRMYCGEKISGFIYSCDFSATGYIFKAKPSYMGWTGTKEYSVVTGGIIAE